MELRNDERVIYIAGGGPSLKGYDWDLLKNKRIIAVNRSYEVIPRAEVVYFTDKRFFNWHKNGLIAHSGVKITGDKNVDHPDIQNYKLTGCKGIDLGHMQLKHGNNSGYAAMNLAVHLGARIIVLLGFDMKFNGKESHWHDGYPVASRPKQYKNMLPCFKSMAEKLDSMGIVVLNACEDSELKEFYKTPLGGAHLI